MEVRNKVMFVSPYYLLRAHEIPRTLSLRKFAFHREIPLRELLCRVLP